MYSICECQQSYHLISKWQAMRVHPRRKETCMRLALLIPARARLPLAIATFCVIWSSAFAVTKLALFDCPPLLLLTARFLLAGLITLGAAAFAAELRHLTGRDIAGLAALGVLNYALYLGLNYMGML